MPRFRLVTNSGASKNNPDPNRCEWIRLFASTQLLMAPRLPAKMQRIADAVKITLDIAKESSDWFPPLKSALGGVTALIKHYEVLISRTIFVHS